LNTVSENKRKPFKQHWTTILMIYYNNKAPLPSYRPEVRLPKNSRQNTSSPLNTQRDKSSGYQAIPKVVEKTWPSRTNRAKQI
jgi:hypothetical protein